MASTNIEGKPRGNIAITNILAFPTLTEFYPLNNTTVWGDVVDNTVNPFPAGITTATEQPYRYLEVINSSLSRILLAINGMRDNVLVVDAQASKSWSPTEKIAFNMLFVRAPDALPGIGEVTIVCRRVV